MISGDDVKQEVRQALAQTPPSGLGLLQLRSEEDLQALIKLIRELGSNPLLAQHLADGRGFLQLQILPGVYEGCACHGHAASPGTAPVEAAMVPALGGLVTQSRLQAANLEGQGRVILDQDAVLTPSAKDWLRQNKVQVQRSGT